MSYKPQVPPQLAGTTRTEQHGDSPIVGKVVTSVTSVTQLLRMSFEEFEKADVRVKIAVPWLSKNLWLVSTSSCVDGLLRGGVSRGCVWTATELANLYAIDGLNGNDRRAMAILKAHFNIRILSIEGSSASVDTPVA